jgi:hypothetical protein
MDTDYATAEVGGGKVEKEARHRRGLDAADVGGGGVDPVAHYYLCWCYRPFVGAHGEEED